MEDCQPWLDCDEVKRVKLGERLKFGLGKEVFDAEWQGHTVAYVRLRPERLHQGGAQRHRNLSCSSIVMSNV